QPKKNSKKPVDIYMIIDNPNLAVINATLNRPTVKGKAYLLSSKAHVLKLLNATNTPIPKNTDELTQVYFRAQPVDGSKNKVFKLTLLKSQKDIANNKKPTRS